MLNQNNKLKWNIPKLIDLTEKQKSYGDCVSGTGPTGGDGTCQSGVVVFTTCATGPAPDDGLP